MEMSMVRRYEHWTDALLAPAKGNKCFKYKNVML
jgi:hypothetical protein